MWKNIITYEKTNVPWLESRNNAFSNSQLNSKFELLVTIYENKSNSLSNFSPSKNSLLRILYLSFSLKKAFAAMLH